MEEKLAAMKARRAQKEASTQLSNRSLKDWSIFFRQCLCTGCLNLLTNKNASTVLYNVQLVTILVAFLNMRWSCGTLCKLTPCIANSSRCFVQPKILQSRGTLMAFRKRFVRLRVRSRSVRGPFGVHSGSIRAPFGICSGCLRSSFAVRLWSEPKHLKSIYLF